MQRKNYFHSTNYLYIERNNYFDSTNYLQIQQLFTYPTKEFFLFNQLNIFIQRLNSSIFIQQYIVIKYTVNER